MKRYLSIVALLFMAINFFLLFHDKGSNNLLSGKGLL